MTLLVALTALPTSALAEDELHAETETTEEEEQPPNYFGLSAAYSFRLLHEEYAADENERENLAGFALTYIRVLVPEWLHLAICKPFLFGYDTYESPLEVIFKLPHRVGAWELYAGLGGTLNIRVFEGELESKVGESNVLSFGVIAEVGVSYRINRRWGLELALGYEYIPTHDVIEHELNPVFGVFYGF